VNCVTVLSVTASCMVTVSVMQHSYCTVRLVWVCRHWGFDNIQCTWYSRKGTYAILIIMWQAQTCDYCLHEWGKS